MPKRKRQRAAQRGSKKKPGPTPVGIQPEEEDSDGLDMDDMLGEEELVDSHTLFLTKMKPEELVRKKKPKRRAEDEGNSSAKRPRHADPVTSEEEEQEYERVPRPSTWEDGGEEKKGLHYLLPLKANHGRLIQQDPTHIQTREDGKLDDSLESSPSPAMEPEVSGGVHEEGEESTPKVMTAEELQEMLTKKKEAISLVVSQLMENPEGNISQLKVLRGLCVERDPNLAVTVRKLAMKSFVSVMKDIAPSYHIRELTEAEKSVKVSKDVKRIRHFEHTLLLDYQLFLSQCDETIKVGLSGKGDVEKKKKRDRKKPVILLENDKELSPLHMESLGEVALGCMCDLLESLPHFNYRNNILATLVPLMTSKALSGKVSLICCTAIENVFRGDSVGEVSFEAVQLIARMVKSKSYKTKPAVLRTFLRLQLNDVDDPVSAAGSRSGSAKTKQERKERKKEMKMTKKQKRRLNAEEKLERDLEETSAMESKQKKSKIQTEVLKVVFLTYFRILKHSRHSPLLQPVLEGLAKFAHLINVDFFADLMSVLHSLAETGGLTNKECMQCVLTAFEILSGQGAALNVDPRQFHTQLYGAILQLDAGSTDSDVLLAVNCLDKLLRNHRQVSTQRVLGFVKRLSMMTLQLLPGAALPVLATIKKFIQSYSQCEQLLDVDAMAGSGVYRPDVPDPEMSCASSTSLWELADLRLHYEPTVATYAHHLLHGAPSQGKWTLHPDLARKTPKQLLSQFSLHLDGKAGIESNAGFEPMASTSQPPPHPALKLAQKKKGQYHYLDRGILSTEIKRRAEEASS